MRARTGYAVKKVLIVNADAERPGAQGKMRPGIFIPIFENTLKRRGIAFEYFSAPLSFIKSADIPSGSTVIPVYNEERHCEQASSRKTIAYVAAIEIATRLRSPTSTIANRLRVARIVGDKLRTNNFLNRRGIRMPKVAGASEEVPTFSNVRTGTNQDVDVIRANSALNRKRYNTEFIVTRVSFQGRDYYTVVRAMCVGHRIIAMIPRARDISEGSPSVHGGDTPPNPDLLNYLRSVLIDARRSQFDDIAADIDRALGFGFFAHDFLVDRRHGAVFLCETGFKFHNEVTRLRLEPIKEKLSFASDVTNQVVSSAANAVADRMLVLNCRR
jgi:hypothetical protein